MKIYINNLLKEKKQFGVSRVKNELYKRLPKYLSEFDIKWVESDLPTYGSLLKNCIRILLTEALSFKKGIFFSAYSEFPFFSRMKKVILIHDLNPIKYTDFRFYSKYFHLILKRSFEKDVQIIAVSEFTKNEIINWADSHGMKIFNKIEVVHNGYDKTIFKMLDEKKNLTKAMFGVENYFLFVGNTEKSSKNFKILIEIWENSNLKKNFSLVVVGKINQHYNLPQNHYIKFIGYCSNEELSTLYNNAIALIHPGINEGFGLTPLEAMACGCPVIVADSGALPEVVGEAGILVNPEDKKSVYDAIWSFGKDTLKRKEYIDKGLKRAQMFDWEKSAEKIAEIIRRFMNE